MPTPLLTRLLAVLGFSAVLVAGGAMLLGEHQVRQLRLAATPRAPVAVGGLVYRSSDARTLDPRNPVDRQILRGIPAVQRPLPRDEEWFGVFITVTNPGTSRLPSSRHISLVDLDGHRFLPQPTPRTQRYGYRPAEIAPGRQYPRVYSAPAQNLAAQGALLLFRIPRASYRDGSLELRVADPSSGQPPATMAVS
jgi:hypothetical protein